MSIRQTPLFAKNVITLKDNQKKALDDEIFLLMEDPSSGEIKQSDLFGIRVHKFRMSGKLALLAFTFNEQTRDFTFLALGRPKSSYRSSKTYR